MGKQKASRYDQIIERIFLAHYKAGDQRVPFERAEMEQAAGDLGIQLPKNLGDLLYSFRFRGDLPASIASRAPRGKSWIIRLVGRSQYCFAAIERPKIIPRSDMAATKIPDATPGIISKYATEDEQALLAKLRYNRLIDIFTGVTCYSLQSHLRTAVAGVGQVETDEVYVGVDRRGVHYIFPVQAKGGKGKLSIVQIEQDLAIFGKKHPSVICRPIAAQFMSDDTIALFEFEQQGEETVISLEKHYRLVPEKALSPEELKSYQNRTPNG